VKKSSWRRLSRGSYILAVLCVVAAVAMIISQHAARTEALTTNASGIHEVIPGRSQSTLEEIAGGSLAFMFDLYKVIGKSQGNLFFSPYSISTAISMVYCGARGKTGEEIGSALHFSLPPSALSSAVAVLNKKLIQTNGLSMANSLWIQKGYPLIPSFFDLMDEEYGAPPHTIDFSASPTSAQEEINAWVKEETVGKIGKLIPPDGVDSTTSLVLANAICFQGIWKYQFEPLPETGDFHLLDDSIVKISMMSVAAPLEYMQGDSFQALVLPYKEGLSMLILVPDQGIFEAFQDSLVAENFSSILTSLEKHTVTVTMPHFEYTSGFRLREALESLGMKEAFSPTADFSGMSSDPLQIDEVFHKAFIHVDEQGTDAAAATGTSMLRSLTRNITVNINRPFIFFIRDEASGAMLFMGRVVSPQVEE